MNRKTSLTLKLLFRYYKQKDSMLFYTRIDGVYITYIIFKSIKNNNRYIII